MSNVQQLTTDDERLQYAKDMALLYLPIFVERFQKRKDGEEFLIKAGIVEGEVVEHLWIELNGYIVDSGIYSGTVSNKPVDIKEMKMGDLVDVELDDINDLMIISGGSFEGGFLATAMEGRDLQPIKEKKSFMQKIGF